MPVKKSALYLTLPTLLSLMAQTQYTMADGAADEYGNDCFNGVLGHQSYNSFIINDRSEIYRHQGPEYVRKFCVSVLKSRGFQIEN